jgi:hypothetical protein
MRGTEDLLPEQKPTFGKRRKRKLRGRAQPYRPLDRQPGPTLTAILKGRPTFLPNPMDARRAAIKKRKR